MSQPPLPADEVERLAALHDSGLLFSPPNERLDRLTRLARRLFGVDIVLISLVADDFQWFKSRQGLDVEQTERCVAFCAYTILQDAVLMVSDATRDARFKDNPLVQGAPHIRFYAGVPIHLPSGYKVGTLCLIHPAPMDLDTEQQALLQDLAQQVELEIGRIELEQQLVSAELTRKRLESVIAGTNVGTWEWNVQTGETVFNERWAEMVGYTLDELQPVSINTWQAFAHPDDLAASDAALQKHFRGEATFYDVTCRMRHKAGHWVWVHDRGRVISRTPAGEPLWMAGTHADVSAQVQAREELEQREQQYRSLVNHIPGVTYRCAHDDNWTMLFMSDKVDPLSGYPASDFIQNRVRSYQSIIHQDDREWLDEQVARQVAAGESWLLEYRICHRDGGIRWAQERGTPIYDQQGGLRFLDGFILDITESRLLQDEQARQLQAFKVLHDIASFPANNVVEQTRHALRLAADFLQLETAVLCRIEGPALLARACITPAGTGWTEGETFPLADSLFTQVLENGDVLALASLSPQQHQGCPVSSQKSLHTYIGVPVIVDEQVYGVLSFVDRAARPRDFSESECLFMQLLGGWASASISRHYATRAVRQSENRLRGLFELSPYGIALNDYATGAFIDINPALLASTGYTRDEFLQLSYWQVTPEEYADAEQAQLRSMEATGRYGPYEKEYIRKDGSRYPVLLHGMRLEDGGGRALIWSYIEDISERKRIERLKDEFLSSVSHELRTPLTAIKGSLALVNAGALGALPAPVTDLLAIAGKNAERLLLLINDLLDMEKLLAGQMRLDLEWHALPPLLDMALLENQPFADQYEVGLRLQGVVPAVDVHVDPGRLQQVMTNLISNAVKFSPAGAEVLVSASPGPIGVRISVTDTGPGIPDAFKSRIFEKFSQADASDARQKGGTGLGLAITRELVEFMHGAISFESETGQGTSFHVDLPLQDAAGGP